jgi:hypothetical protein
MLFYMWPTKYGDGYILAAKVEADNLDAAFKAIKDAGLPKPIPVGIMPPEWSSEPKKT